MKISVHTSDETDTQHTSHRTSKAAEWEWYTALRASGLLWKARQTLRAREGGLFSHGPRSDASQSQPQNGQLAMLPPFADQCCPLMGLFFSCFGHLLGAFYNRATDQSSPKVSARGDTTGKAGSESTASTSEEQSRSPQVPGRASAAADLSATRSNSTLYLSWSVCVCLYECISVHVSRVCL